MKNILKNVRKEAGISQEKLSKISGVSKTTISELENDKTEVITNISLSRLSKALGRKVSDIFFRD